MVAEVIIDSKVKTLNKKFDYEIPEQLQDLLEVGSRVLVPFGKLKTLEQGYIIKIKEKSEYELKTIVSLEENLPKEKIELSRWMARKYFCNVSECIKLMLTPGTSSKNKEDRVNDRKVNFVYFNIPYEEIEIKKLRGEKQKKLIEFLRKNEGATIPEIENFAGVLRGTVNSLVNKNILKIEEKKIDRNPLINKKIEKDKKLKLNDEQELAYKKIEKSIEENKYEEFLLYGVTGSRKNRNIFAINRKSTREK